MIQPEVHNMEGNMAVLSPLYLCKSKVISGQKNDKDHIVTHFAVIAWPRPYVVKPTTRIYYSLGLDQIAWLLHDRLSGWNLVSLEGI
jgi:hypothetical protein